MKTAIRRLASCHPPQRANVLVAVFWHGCTNKLRFIQVRDAGSRCYCCNYAAHQTAHSLYRPSPPERLCNEGVIGLITLCLPIMLVKWSGLFPNTLWQSGEEGGASSINDTSFICTNLGLKDRCGDFSVFRSVCVCVCVFVGDREDMRVYWCRNIWGEILNVLVWVSIPHKLCVLKLWQGILHIFLGREDLTFCINLKSVKRIRE